MIEPFYQSQVVKLTIYMFVFVSQILTGNAWCCKKKYESTELGDRRLVGFMVFIATFNNIFSYIMAVSFIVEETRVPGENHQPTTSHWQTFISTSCTSRSERDSNSQHQWW